MATPQKSELIESSWKRQHTTQAAKEALYSTIPIVAVFVVLFTDMSFSFFSGPLSLSHPLLWFIELLISIILVFQIIRNGFKMGKYFWIYLFGSTIDITEEQRKLMAISENDRGFRTPPKSNPENRVSPPMTFTYSPSYAQADISPHRLAKSFTVSPLQQYHTPLQQHSPGMQTPYASRLSTSFRSASLNASLNSSLDRSLNLSNISQSSAVFDPDRSSHRSRRSSSVPLNPRSSHRKRITNLESLDQYIKEEEEKEQNKIQASPDNLSSGNMSFWNFGSSPLDFTHVLKRFAYQLAPRFSTSSTPSSANDQASCLGNEKVWNKFGVSEDDLYNWTEKLRKWLSFTIVGRLMSKIDEVNSTLQKIGCEDTEIGEVGISTLKQIALTRGNSVPVLNSLVPYLDFTANQEYMAKRLKALSTGCMSAYSWNKGGDYGKTWGEHLPSDASVIMHLFCCYMDSRLPAQPKYPDGKTFSAAHFLKMPDKPSLDKENLLIYQSSINPPHYQVIIGSESYDLPKGRNNMFHAMLFFLYHIKEKEAGMLGRVNLGMSGLNILWIFD